LGIGKCIAAVLAGREPIDVARYGKFVEGLFRGTHVVASKGGLNA